MSHAQQVVLKGIAQPERRRHPRYTCALPVEIKIPEVVFPSLGETSDISLCGCYIRSGFCMAVGLEVELRIWVGNASVRTRAVVRTSDPGLGNGIEFMGLDVDGERVLSAYFARLDASPAGQSFNSVRDALLV